MGVISNHQRDFSPVPKGGDVGEVSEDLGEDSNSKCCNEDSMLEC
jgi:hypothetical protein